MHPVTPDLPALSAAEGIRHPVHLALRFTQGHSEPFASLKDRLGEESQVVIPNPFGLPFGSAPSFARGYGGQAGLKAISGQA